jgi:hypothetical protein
VVQGSLYIQYAREQTGYDEVVLQEYEPSMSIVEEYVTSIEGTCGQERSVIVSFKHAKKDEAIAKILKKAKLKNSLSGAIFELVFKGNSFRLFSTGKAIFSSVPSKEVLNSILTELLL